MEKGKLTKKEILKKNQKGSTMVETLVSFVVLFLVLASLYGIVAFSAELYMRSVDTSRMTQKFYKEIYKKDEFVGVGTNPFIKKQNYKAGFGATEGENRYSALELSVIIDDTNFTGDQRMKNSKIKLSNTSAKTYVAQDEAFKEKNIIVPKAVRFDYSK